MLATLIPFFDKNMKVRAYSLFSQKENSLLNPPIFGTSSATGLAEIEGLDIVRNIGIDTLSPGTDVLIPVNHIAIFPIWNHSVRICAAGWYCCLIRRLKIRRHIGSALRS